MQREWHIGVIGGSGLYADIGLADAQQIAVHSPFGEPSGPVTLGRIGPVRFSFIARHGEGHRLPPSAINYRANIDVLKRCGVTDVVAISAIINAPVTAMRKLVWIGIILILPGIGFLAWYLMGPRAGRA